MSSIAPPPSQGWSSFFSLIPTTTGSTSDIGPGVQTAIPQTPAPSIEDFATWDRLSQTVYATLYSSASLTSTPAGQPSVNYAIRLGPDGLPQSRLASSTNAADWKTLPAGTTAKVASPSNLAANTFLGWTTLGQQAYLKAANVDQNVGLRESDGSYSRYQLNQYGHIIKTPLGQLGQGLEPTPGMRIDFNGDGEVDIPYYHLPGSSDGNSGALISQGAAYLFPALDGYNGSLADTIGNKKPTTFDTWTPTAVGADEAKAKAFLEDFKTWHSSFQTEWVKKYATTANPVVEMPSGSQLPIVSLFITNQDPRSVVNVATVTKEAIAKLSQNDQTTLQKSQLFTKYTASQLGVAIAVWNAPTDANPLNPGSPIDADVQSVATDFNAFYKLAAANLPDNPNATTPPLFDAGAFADQLGILRTKMMSGGMVNTKLVAKEILDLRQRYDRAKNYYDAGYGSRAQGTTTITVRHDGLNSKNPLGIKVYTNIVSTDNAETIKQGYRTFIAQEEKLAENAKKRFAATDETQFPGMNGKPFDLPTLIYYLQDLYNSDLEALVTIETEGVRQTNAYLKDYADWQDMVNNTLSKWGKDDTSTKGLNGGSTGDGNTFLNEGNLNDGKDSREVKLALMFDALSAGYRHPVEMAVTGQSEKVTRPGDFHVFTKDTRDNNGINYDFNQYTRDVWQTYGTRLGEKVTQLNQDSQQKMNDINNLDKQRNRHYDLANSALSKMNDALQAILRATG